MSERLLPEDDPLDAPADLVDAGPGRRDRRTRRPGHRHRRRRHPALRRPAGRARGVPLLGINRGRLGFLTDVMPQDMLASVDAALEGRCERDERALLEARLVSADGVVAQRARAQRRRAAEVGNRPHARFRNLDRRRLRQHAWRRRPGGRQLPPVRPPTPCPAAAPSSSRISTCWCVAPICPHTLSDRPIVVSGRSVIAVKLIDRPDTRAQVTCDGVVLGELVPGDRLEVHPDGAARSRCCIRPVRVLPPAALQAALGPRRIQLPSE